MLPSRLNYRTSEVSVSSIWLLSSCHGALLTYPCSQNRFKSPLDLRLNPAAFSRLEELQLSATLTTWTEFRSLLPHLPALRAVELGYNKLRALSQEISSIHVDVSYQNSSLQDVNLDGNELDNFADISSAMRNFTGSVNLPIYSVLTTATAYLQIGSIGSSSHPIT